MRGFPECLSPVPHPVPPRGSPGHDSDVKAGLAPGVQEGQQPPLEVWKAGYVALCEAILSCRSSGELICGGAGPQVTALQAPGPSTPSPDPRLTSYQRRK